MQVLCLAEQIQFTEDVERALKEQNLQQLEVELNAKLEHYTTVDTSSEDHANTGSFVCVCVYALLIIYSVCLSEPQQTPMLLTVKLLPLGYLE